MLAKKQGCHSIAQADKQINEKIVHVPPVGRDLIFVKDFM